MLPAKPRDDHVSHDEKRELLTGVVMEMRRDYLWSVKKSMLDYVLKSAEERRRAQDPPCPWNVETEAQAKAHFGEAEVASWGGPPAVEI